MRHTVALAFIALSASCAFGEIQFFFTHSQAGWGMDPNVSTVADPFVPSSGTGLDYARGYKLAGDSPGGEPVPPIAPGTTALPDVTIDVGSSAFAYVWMHFDATETIGAKITGVEQLAMQGAAQVCYYDCDNTGAGFGQRWGSIGPVLTANPTTLTPSPTGSIVNSNADAPLNLYWAGGEAGHPEYHTALLGAVRGDQLATIVGSMQSLFVYPDGERTWRFLNQVVCVPEPSAVLLLTALSLLRRR